jgi:hypothetical protein
LGEETDRMSNTPGALRARLVSSLLAALLLALLSGSFCPTRALRPAASPGHLAYLPIVFGPLPVPSSTPTPTQTPPPRPTLTPTAASYACQPVPDPHYGTLRIEGSPDSRPAAEHADKNLALRGWAPAAPDAAATFGYCGRPSDDSRAPQLRGLFADHRIPTILGVYRIWQWDWDCSCRGDNLEPGGPACASGRASMLMLAVTPGEELRVPNSGYCIEGSESDCQYEVLVLYASEDRITLKYSREDNVLKGYTLHLERICVEPSLLALYRQMDRAGRWNLPAIKAGRPFARASGSSLGLVIRDSGNWMDPRCCNDWWRTPG